MRCTSAPATARGLTRPPAATASSHSIISARTSAGSRISACSRKPSTKLRNAARLVTVTSTTVSPESVRAGSTLASGAERAQHAVDVPGVDREPDGHGRRVADHPRAVLDVIVGAEVGRYVERVRLADLDVAVDAVGAERADAPRTRSKPDDVPVPALRREPPRLERARLAAVGEVDDRAVAERVEQRRERRGDRQATRSAPTL